MTTCSVTSLVTGGPASGDGADVIDGDTGDDFMVGDASVGGSGDASGSGDDTMNGDAGRDDMVGDAT